jgi:hypothetical protein
MTAAAKKHSTVAAKKQETGMPKPKRLSKFALWRQANPNGIIEYVDWRAANR